VDKLLKLKKLIREVWDYNVISKFKILKPKALTVILTYKCNSQCVMCNIWQLKPEKEMEYKDWEKMSRDRVFGEVETLTVTGGEGTLYPEYTKTVQMWIRKLPKLQKLIVNTNGFLPEDISKKVGELVKICNEREVRLEVTVSVDGLNERHNKIRGVKDGFDKVLKTITYLEKMKQKGWLDFGVASVLMRDNLADYWKMKDWFKKRKLNYSFQLVGFHNTYVNNIKSKEYLDFEKSQSQELLKVMGDIRKDKNGLMGYYWADMFKFYQGRRRQTPCPFLVDELVVDSLGDVYYCLSTEKVGNILKEKRSVGEIFFDPKNIQRRKRMWCQECRRCNSGCDVIRGIAGDAKGFMWYKLTGSLKNN